MNAGLYTTVFWLWHLAKTWGKTTVHYLSHHSGLPVVVVAAVLIAIGCRLLKKTARFAVEVALVTAALALASELGMLRW